ncbi:zinc finger protein 449-like [Loxodonta africana]|uniref:zinc finger protein 449-like n=1 Tax=Loxodonta africana TaxID=9785 RepID=UPI0030D011ED
MAVALGCAIQASLNQGSTLKEYDTECEVFRQRFRQFQYQQAAGPREAFNSLWELCSQWLKPTIHSKEEILELLVLEQFLTILPSEIETWVRLYRPENRERALALVEDLQRELEIPEQQEATVAEEQIPQAGPQYPRDGDDRECQPFSEPAAQVNEMHDKLKLENPWPRRYRFLFLLLGFDIGSENEENISQQKKLENAHPFNFTFEGNALHARVLPEKYKQLENKQENLPYLSELVGDQNHPLGEKPSGSNLEEHLIPKPNKKKSPRGKPHQCSHCGKRFPQKSQLTGHQIIHSGTEPYHCPECGKSVLRRSDFYRHQRLHIGKRPHECSIRKKQFTRRSHLIDHHRIHLEGETYKCLECRKSFHHPSSLKRHLKTHTGEKPHRCDTCGKSFIRPAALTLHQTTHSGERPFKCNYCEKTFRRKPNLVIHLRIHTGEKPYKCSYCSQSFRQRTGLIMHQITHLTELLRETGSTEVNINS